MAELVTTRLSLVAPDPGTSEPVDLADHLADNWAKIDAVIGATPCTSGTRPGSPFDGQLIRETDTRQAYVWNATQARWDQLIGARICTSGTRPSSPSDGMFIRETDTGRVYVWNATGSTWDRMAKFSEIATELAAAYTWQSFTPVWSSSSTAPSIGNGTRVGRYIQIGKLVTYQGKILFGSTTTFGTGIYSFTLPVTAANDGPISMVGSAYLRDESASSAGHFLGAAIINPLVSTTALNLYGGTNAVVGQTVPFTWANTDSMSWSITYQVP